MDSINRFLNYIKINTQSDDTTGTTPSTEHQKNLGKLLVQELIELGLTDAVMDKWGNVYAHLNGEQEHVGFNAHIDTALEITDENVNPQIIKNYDGKDIILNNKYKLSQKDFPNLKNHIGHDLITTDGNTLLGADDKAGIAIIMNALEYFKNNPSVRHKNISIAFTVDEEIGEGTDHFNLKAMNADYAYTIDGADISQIEYENYNAEAATITFNGFSIHPGEGTGKLINALLMMNTFINNLPKNETPFEAKKDDGYWHLNNANGTSESITLNMIIRDFEYEGIEKRKKDIINAIEATKKVYPTGNIQYEIYHQYENMKKYVIDKKEVLTIAETALIKNGLVPKYAKIKGGTDGATLSKMGLPTPNLGTGSYNHHGRYEFLDINEFKIMTNVVIDIMKI